MKWSRICSEIIDELYEIVKLFCKTERFAFVLFCVVCFTGFLVAECAAIGLCWRAFKWGAGI